MARYYNISKKLSWYDRLSINVDGVKTCMILLDWYKYNPCAVIIDNVEQKGPYISQAVYSRFSEHACTCRKRRTRHK